MPNEFAINKKVEVKIQRILSELLSLKVSDPRLKNVIISEVRVTKDISTAKVYFLILNQQNKTDDGVLLDVHVQMILYRSINQDYLIPQIETIFYLNELTS